MTKTSRNPKLSEDWLDDVMVREEEPLPVQTSDAIKLDMERYHAEPSILLKDDPLKWWKERENLFQNMAKLAKKYLVIPASSVLSERIFSLAGNIVSRKRASLQARECGHVSVLKEK